MDYSAHENEEKAEGYEEHSTESLCHGCRFGFCFSTSKTKYEKEPGLAVYCTGPWFEHARQTECVTNCNGFVSGMFDPHMFSIEKALDGMKADGPDTTPDSTEEIRSHEEIEKSLDDELAALEKETAELSKAQGEDPKEGDEDPPKDEGAKPADEVEKADVPVDGAPGEDEVEGDKPARDPNQMSIKEAIDSKGKDGEISKCDDGDPKEMSKAFGDGEPPKKKDEDDKPPSAAPPVDEEEEADKKAEEDEAKEDEAGADEEDED